MKRILLIEDNKEISNNIKEYLTLENFEIIQAFDGETWFNEAVFQKYDLILLDLMLPKIDWITVAKKLSKKINTPIIIITARDALSQKLEWFESGAIDYIVKPFDLRELEARIKAHLHLKNSNIIEFKNLQIDLEKREFIKENNQIKITTKEYLIFKYLYENQSRDCTRTDIIEYVWWWEDLFTEDAKLDVYISNLRRKLNKKLIETVKWVGYKFGV